MELNQKFIIDEIRKNYEYNLIWILMKIDISLLKKKIYQIDKIFLKYTNLYFLRIKNNFEKNNRKTCWEELAIIDKFPFLLDTAIPSEVEIKNKFKEHIYVSFSFDELINKLEKSNI